MRKPAPLLLPFLLLAACGGDHAPGAATPDAAPPAWVATDWVLPSSTGSAQPNLVATADGRLLLTWINSVPGRRNALRFAALDDNGRWASEARTIVVGDALMANWADVPHIMATADGALWVHWLQKAGNAGYASDIALSRSVDGGFNWAAPILVNDDSVVAEHGFAALWPAGDDALGVAWLDGRNSAMAAAAGATDKARKERKDTDHAAMASGRTELRAEIFDRNFARSRAAVIDPGRAIGTDRTRCGSAG